MHTSSVFCKADDKLSMLSVTKIDKIKRPVVIAFLIMVGSLTSKHLAIIPDESVPWYLLTRRVGGVSEFKHRWTTLRWPWPLTLVVVVNEAFCIIDYLKSKDISVILCHRALALSQKQKNYSGECVFGAVVGDLTEWIRGLGVKHWLVTGSWHQSTHKGVKRKRSSPALSLVLSEASSQTAFSRALGTDSSQPDYLPQQVTETCWVNHQEGHAPGQPSARSVLFLDPAVWGQAAKVHHSGASSATSSSHVFNFRVQGGWQTTKQDSPWAQTGGQLLPQTCASPTLKTCALVLFQVEASFRLAALGPCASSSIWDLEPLSWELEGASDIIQIRPPVTEWDSENSEKWLARHREGLAAGLGWSTELFQLSSVSSMYQQVMC